MFSGIGGFEVGLQNSKHDFQCVGFSEIDPYAVSIYEKNFPNHINYGDATKIRTEELPDFDFLVGGFPCQAFSVAGKRRGFDDTRGTLFFEIARVLKDKRPRYFLLENVRGLLSHEKGKTFQTILKVLSDLGYVVQWTLLNSADFKVPQRRERVFVEGYIREECRGKVLSVRRNCQKDTPKVSNTYYGTRQGRVHYGDEHMNTLACDGHNGGGVKLLSNPRTGKVERERALKRISPQGNSQGKRVYDSDGLSIAINASGVNDYYLERDCVQLNNKHKTYQDGRVYSHNGLSIAMNARGNNGWYTTDDENEQEVKKMYSKDRTES